MSTPKHPMEKVTTEMPTEGQFVAVWVFSGVVWSHVCKMEAGGFYVWYDVRDGHSLETEWVEEDIDCQGFESARDHGNKVLFIQ